MICSHSPLAGIRAQPHPILVGQPRLVFEVGSFNIEVAFCDTKVAPCNVKVGIEKKIIAAHTHGL